MKFQHEMQSLSSNTNSIVQHNVQHNVHSTWACVSIVPYVAHVIGFLRTECRIVVDITLIEYIFGFQDKYFVGLNHILLELKK